MQGFAFSNMFARKERIRGVRNTDQRIYTRGVAWISPTPATPATDELTMPLHPQSARSASRLHDLKYDLSSSPAKFTAEFDMRDRRLTRRLGLPRLRRALTTERRQGDTASFLIDRQARVAERYFSRMRQPNQLRAPHRPKHHHQNKNCATRWEFCQADSRRPSARARSSLCQTRSFDRRSRSTAPGSTRIYPS